MPLEMEWKVVGDAAGGWNPPLQYTDRISKRRKFTQVTKMPDVEPSVTGQKDPDTNAVYVQCCAV